jgi:hypothetical protein
VRLPSPNIAASTLQVYITTIDETAVPPAPTTVLTEAWQLDERNGLLKLTDASYLGKRVLVAGYHYTWFSESDIEAALHAIGTEFVYGKPPGTSIGDLSDVEIEVAQMGAVVRLLWSLSIELALDIDVSTPEGMSIPAHQRYTQVWQMMQYWEGEYTTRAESLNVGLGMLEQFRLRRVSFTTGRYVPVYRDREIDDPRWPQRLYPPIPIGVAPGELDRTVAINALSVTDEWGPTLSTGGGTAWYPATTYPEAYGRGS